MPPVLKNSAYPIIIDDFGGGSGMGIYSPISKKILQHACISNGRLDIDFLEYLTIQASRKDSVCTRY